MPITQVPPPAETPETIHLHLTLANGFGLKEVRRGMKQVVEHLEKMRKKLGDEGINSDVPQRLRVWNGTDGHVGVLAQLAEQMEAFLPKAAPEPPPIDDDGQVDAFADAPDPFDAAPVSTDPTGRAPEMTPTGLRDLLAQAHVFIPAVVIERTWDAEQRLAAESWAGAALLSRGGAEGVELPERPAWCESYELPEDYRRDDQGVVYGPNDRRMDAETFTGVWEAFAKKRVAPEEVLPGPGPWLVVDTGKGEGLARYEVMHQDTRERMPVDGSWCYDHVLTTTGAVNDLSLAQAYAAHLSGDVQPVNEEAALDAGSGALPEFDPDQPDAVRVAGEDDPAPAVVRTALLHAMYDVPVEVIASWSRGERVEAMVYGYAFQRGDTPGPDEPDVLVRISWDVDPETGVAHHPAQTFNFELAGKKKPVRIRDRDSGRYYGDDWSMAEAEAVLLAWSNGEPAEVKGRTLQVRDAAVALEPVRGGEAGGEG